MTLGQGEHAMTLNKETQSLADVAREAIAVQNACNLSGVAHSFLDAIATIRNSASGTREVNTHPIVTLYISKLASLNGTDCLCGDCMDSFSRAMDACKKLVKDGAL
jgi:hypothetical protein